MDFAARRILLCLRYGIGDVVMELPVIRALRRAVPEARITALGAPPALELLEGSGLVDELASLQRWGLRHRWDRGGPEAPARLHPWLDEQSFDLYLDVHHAPPVIGEVVWSRGIRSLEASEAVEAAVVGRGGDGVAAIRAGVRAGWGLDVPDDQIPHLQLRPDEQHFAEQFLRTRGIDGNPPLGVSPVASRSLKRWPVDRFAAAVDRALEAADAPVLLFQGPQQGVGRELREALARRGRTRVEVVGPIHLRAVAALLARCSAFLCNDTGLMHVAAAVGAPTVAVFGPTAARIYAPPAPHALGVEAAPAACPHRNTTSLHPPECFAGGECLVAEQSCIQQVGVDRVVAALHAARCGRWHAPDPLATAG